MKIRFLMMTLVLATAFTSCFKTQKVADLEDVEYTPPGELVFKANSKLYKAQGTFREWRFTEVKSADNLEELEALIEINMRTVFEKTIRLTKDLESDKFFDIENYPTSEVRIFNVRRLNPNEDRYKADVELTLKEQTEAYETTFEVTQREPLHVKGYVTVLREAYGLGEEWKSVENEVVVEYDTDVKI